MADSYTFPKPANAQDAGIYDFLQQFYRISDTPGAHDIYTDQFAQDATFILGSRKAQGAAEIRQLREGMWAKVASRRHEVHGIFPAGAAPGGEEPREVMLHGTVAYRSKEGVESVKDWAGRATVVRGSGDGRWRFKFYQVYLDTAA